MGLYAPHTMSGPHYSQRLVFDTPVLDFEAYPKWISITSPALDFCFAEAVEVGLVFGLVEKDVTGLAFGFRQWIDVSEEQQQRILPTHSIFVLTFISSNVIEAVSSTSTLSLLASSSTSGSASILVFSPLLSSHTSRGAQQTIILTLRCHLHPPSTSRVSPV